MRRSKANKRHKQLYDITILQGSGSRYKPSLQLRFKLRKALKLLLWHKVRYLSVSLSVLFVDNKTMKSLNARFRGINEVTDVLSFATGVLTGDTMPIPLSLSFLPLGDIVIAADVARQNAELNMVSLEREIAFLALHGLLHLLGYDHDQSKDEGSLARMLLLQEAVLKLVW